MAEEGRRESLVGPAADTNRLAPPPPPPPQPSRILRHNTAPALFPNAQTDAPRVFGTAISVNRLVKLLQFASERYGVTASMVREVGLRHYVGPQISPPP